MASEEKLEKNDDNKDDNKDDDDHEDDEVKIDEKQKKKKKKTKKKKKKKWEMEEYIGSVSIKLKIKFDVDRGQDGLKKAGWFCNRRGKIIAIDGGIKPTPNDCPDTFLVQEYISFILQDKLYYNLKLIEIMENEKLKVARSNIYISDNYNKKETILMVIPGTGIVNAGEFATSVAKFDNIIIGTAFPFIEWSIDKDIGLILFDPNTMSKHHENILDEIHCVHIFDSYIKPYLGNNISNILILAHSAGGRRTTYLLKERGDIIKNYIKKIAFTDIKDPKEQLFKYERNGEKDKVEIVKKIYKETSKNWVKTKTGKKLDEAIKKGAKSAICKKVSSGHSDHKYTTPSAYPSIVSWFEMSLNNNDV